MILENLRNNEEYIKNWKNGFRKFFTFIWKKYYPFIILSIIWFAMVMDLALWVMFA